MIMYESPIQLFSDVAIILQDELEVSDIDKLKEQLSSMSIARYNIVACKKTMYEALLKARNRVLLPKSKDYTELDRKVQQGSAISQQEADYDFLCNIDDILKERIELGSLILQTL